MSKKILSVAVLLAGASIALAQDVPIAAPVAAPPLAAPAAEAPVAETPVVETPVVEAPIAAPVAAPVAEAPIAAAVTEAPVPAAEVPVAKSSTEVAAVNLGGTKIAFYGRLELNSYYEDNKNSGVSSMFASEKPKKDPQGRTGLAVNRTRLGMNLSGPSKEGEPDLKGRFEVDFSGNTAYNNFSAGQGFRVRQSYGSVGFKDLGLTILFGQTDDVITPLDPPSVNPSSLNGAGNIGNRRPQIRLTQALGPAELAVAATHDRLCSWDRTADGTKCDDNLPSSSPGVQGRLGLKVPASWAGEKANLALGVGYLYAKNEASNDVDDTRAPRLPSTYAIAADLSLPLMDILTLTGEFFMGQNLKRYGDGSLSISDVELYKKKDNGDIDTLGVSSMGFWAGLALKLPANFSVGTAIGMENLDDDVVKVYEKKTSASKVGNMFILANLAYNFTSAAKVTLEWTNLTTDFVKEKDDKKVTTDGSLNRYELNFRYDFK